MANLIRSMKRFYSKWLSGQRLLALEFARMPKAPRAVVGVSAQISVFYPRVVLWRCGLLVICPLSLAFWTHATPQVEELETFRATYEDITAKLNSANALGSDHYDAMHFVVSAGKKDERATKQAHRYRKMKICNKLATGGYGRAYAKAASMAFFQERCAVSTNPDEFKHDAIAMWTPTEDSGVEPQWTKRMVALQQASASSLEARKKKLSKSLADNPKWTGAMVSIPGAITEVTDWEFKKNPVLSDQPGAEPWLVFLKSNCWRSGPSGVPLPGVGSFYHALSNQIVVQLFPIAGLLAKGISMHDIHNFLQTPSGLTFFNNEAKLVHMQKGATLWVPYGWMAVSVSTGNEHAKEEEEEVGALWCLAVFVVEWAKELSNDVWAAIAECNDTWMSKQDLKLWKSRAEVMRAFQDLVKA